MSKAEDVRVNDGSYRFLCLPAVSRIKRKAKIMITTTKLNYTSLITIKILYKARFKGNIEI